MQVYREAAESNAGVFCRGLQGLRQSSISLLDLGDQVFLLLVLND
jgi:hypothetical protein